MALNYYVNANSKIISIERLIKDFKLYSSGEMANSLKDAKNKKPLIDEYRETYFMQYAFDMKTNEIFEYFVKTGECRPISDRDLNKARRNEPASKSPINSGRGYKTDGDALSNS